MTKEQLLIKIQAFEEEMSKIPAPNMAYGISPILRLMYAFQRGKKRKMEEVYKELLADLDSMEAEIGPKNYMGWRRRVKSAYES